MSDGINIEKLRQAARMLDKAGDDRLRACAMTHAQCAKLSTVEDADRIWARHPHHPKDHPLIFWPDGHTTTGHSRTSD